ncbi:MAG: 2OG-Fe(II) oxygenase [Alphaproteobacteria bacterium]|nr:2OG-Fe(II) oxygenase [Alphaproteobacteria bacterium]
MSTFALDLDRLNGTPLTRDPFEFIIVPGFLKAEAIPALHADFPKVKRPGSHPTSTLRIGATFGRLLAALEGPEMRAAIEKKFSVDLTGRPTMITVRGRCRAEDGGIHTDSVTKIITALIYFNGRWENAGGRLRLLRNANDIEDYVAEVPPEEGTLLAFRRSDRSFHGHKSFEGERRAIQLNWVTGPDVVRRELGRHRLSAWFKSLNPFS